MGRRLILGAVLFAWFAAAVVGWAWMKSFSLTAGVQADAPALLPAGLSVAEETGAGTRMARLFVALHPQCSCSYATTEAFAGVLRQEHASQKGQPGRADPVDV